MPSSSPLIHIAAAQYNVSYFTQWQQFEQKLARWVAEAHQQQAQLLVFPEYAALELCSLFTPNIQQDLQQQLFSLQSLLPHYLQTYQALAQQYQVTLVAGSFPVQIERNQQAIFVNRSYVIHPDGQFAYQDKQVMTRFEKESWGISPSEVLQVIDTAVGKIGICICYDSEFPLIARRLVELGAEMLIVPSVTDSMAGYYRVKIGSQARALENQCYVIHAPLVGQATWSLAVDENIGCAAIYTPVDHGFPENGILSQGEMNQTQWVYATLDRHNITRVRTHGQVLNYRDWPLSLR